MFFNPFLSFVKLEKPLLLIIKLFSVHTMHPFFVGIGLANMVQHLVIDRKGDYIPGELLAVEHAMDLDEAQMAVVEALSHARSVALIGFSKPGDRQTAQSAVKIVVI